MSDIEFDDDGSERIKVILVGNAWVGKTNLIRVSTGKAFEENSAVTLNVSFLTKKMKIDDKYFNLYLWDTVGSEKLRAMTNLFYKNSKIVIFVYDITDENSFNDLNVWVKDVKSQIGDNFVKGVVGNKNDLFVNEKVNEIVAEKYAKSINAKFRTTSAKNEPKGLEIFLEELLREYINNKEKYINNDIPKNNIKIKKNGVKEKKKCCLSK